MRNLILYLDEYRKVAISLYTSTDTANDPEFIAFLIAKISSMLRSVDSVDANGNTLLHLVLESLSTQLSEKDRYVLLYLYYALLLSSPHVFLPNKSGITPYSLLVGANAKNAIIEQTYSDWNNAFKLQCTDELDRFNALMLLKTETDVVHWLSQTSLPNGLKAYLEKPLFIHPKQGAYTPYRILNEAGNFTVLSLLRSALKLKTPSLVDVESIILGDKRGVNVHRGPLLMRWGLTKTASDLILLEKKRIIADVLKPIEGMDVLLFGVENRTTQSLRNEWNIALLGVLKNLAQLVSSNRSQDKKARIVQYHRRVCQFGTATKSIRLIQQVLYAFPNRNRALNDAGRLDPAQILALNHLAEYVGLAKRFNQFKQTKHQL